jgi:aerobic-type carbon monoxide dehydrogenase small subunit (CoxS/CutS family)
MQTTVTLTVNGQKKTVRTHSQRRLLELLREEFGLTGTKYGCGEGQCGACTILVGNRRERSCLVTADEAEGWEITTIEGLASGEALHPVQEAFLTEEAAQCGFCTPGMILSAVALLKEKPSPTDTEIVTWMNGQLCRCCGYPNILNAIRRAADNRRREP